MPRSILVRTLVVVCGAATLTACDEATAPLPQAVYVAVTVDGEPLPVSFPPGSGWAAEVLADTLSVEDARYRRAQTFAVRDSPSGPTRIERHVYDGTLAPGSSGWVLAFRCNDGAACVAPDTIVAQHGGGLEVRAVGFAPGLYRYMRADD